MLLIAASVVSVYQAPQASAAQITTRSLTLVANGANGGSAPNVPVNHKFTFTLPTTGTAIGSIKFQYCMTPADVGAGTCVAPTGLSATAATYGPESGFTGFSIRSASTTANSIVITRASATNPPGTAVSYQLNSVVNPTAPNSTFFVRISTYAALDASGTAVDTGSVAASTANPIQLQGIMPESLVFCTGQTVNSSCSTVTNGIISFNQLFSPTDTATATSQMAASTNASNGYAITVNGTTLTSGSNTIPVMAGTTRTQGKSEFGLNLVANTTATSTVAVGANVNPLASTDPTNLQGQPKTGYGTVDSFKFNSGDVVAASDYTTPGTGKPTNAQVYTVSYIVDVAGNQPSGTYSTTLTYICTPTF